VGSARELAELCRNHLVYRWLSGGMEINYHTLSDFRVGHGERLNELLTQLVATLMQQGVIEMKRVAQDGMRVRASAGASSFRRPARIEEYLQEARAQVTALQAQAQEDAGAVGRRQQAARERAARERVARLEAAQKELETLRQDNADRCADRRKEPAELRCSMTDPEARKMRMPDGGFRPAYNVQLATTTVGGVIVGVSVTQAGQDVEQLTPMLQQMEKRYQRRPEAVLVDGGFVSREAINDAESRGTAVYAPVKEADKKLAEGNNPYVQLPGDAPGMTAWRKRMGTEEAKTIYRQRSSTAEWANAQARNRGFYQVRVRGAAKVLVATLWLVLAHNVQRLLTLRRPDPPSPQAPDETAVCPDPS
jgi:hypothetical protein